MTPAQRGQMSEARLAYLLRIAPQEIRESLEPFGYYDAVVDLQVAREGERVAVTAAVAPGLPVSVRQLSLDVQGPAGEDADIGARLRAFVPQPGGVFDHRNYEASKALIARGLAEHGYFDAELATHRVEVTRAAHAADIALGWRSGARYRFGVVRFEGQPLDAGVLDPLVPWKRGEPFDQAQLLALQQSLADTDYFGAINLTPQPDAAVEGEVPVQVTLVPAKRSVYRAGLRYGTDAGAGVTGRLERRYLNRRGHKLLLDLSLAQRDRQLLVQYRIPAFAWLDGWYALTLDVREEEIDELTSQYVNLAATRSGRWRDWELLAGMNFKRERFDALDAQDLDYATVIYPSLWGRWKQGDDPNLPRRGRALTVELRAASRSAGSTVDFVQARAQADWIRGLGADSRLLLRAELGATASPDFADLPPSLRLYAGGDRSVRGFGYKAIGPERNGHVVGGRYLAVGSVEFERMFTPQWGAAVFVDAGDAFDGSPDLKVGFGAGLRWHSPIGPVRVDLAHGVGAGGDAVRLHVRIGPDL
jgi:translocation and assembly module TamA